MDLQEIELAGRLLRPRLPATRLIDAPALSARTGARVLLKMESDHPTASFKVRGALYALLKRKEERPVLRVGAGSTGNHGAAVAYAARCVGVPAVVFLPGNPNPVKRARISALGARIIEGGKDIADALDAALRAAESEPLDLVLDDRDPEIPVGTATIAWEMLEQCRDIDVIYVPVGDTALIRGVAGAAKQLRPGIRIVGVQAEKAPSYYLSWKAGTPVATGGCETIADGLATRTPREDNVREIRRLVDDMVLVTEEELLQAIRLLILEEHVVAEPAGAAATAALLRERRGVAGTVACLVTGANLSPECLSAAARLSRA